MYNIDDYLTDYKLLPFSFVPTRDLAGTARYVSCLMFEVQIGQ